MKDIGILTFHRASNYGAVLQAYALYNVLSKLGRECEIINYRCGEVERSHTLLGLFKSVSLAHAIKRAPQRILKHRVFEEFRQRQMKLGEIVDITTIESIKDKFGFFIVGSDQVWNNNFAGFDESFFLTFANNSQKYSYAASFGFACFPEGLKKEYIDRLSSFHCISVREESAKFMLEAEGLHSRVDVDPTLLLDAAEWKEFSATINGEDKYILVYTVQAPLRLLDKAKELSAKTGFPIIYLNNEHRSNRELKHVRYSTPEEFVGWFANAEYVFTNSFHGTAFSVIFSKKFKVEIETRNSINYRSRDFVVGLGLEKSILYQDDPLEFDYNWVNTEEILEGKRRNSLLYLESIGKGTGSES